MFSSRIIYLAVLSWFTAVPPVLAQSEETSEVQVNRATLREFRDQAGENPALDEEVRKEAVDLYDQAIGHLRAAEESRSRALEFQAELSAIDESIESIRARLDELREDPTLTVAEDADTAEIESALTQETARLTSLRASLRDVEQLAEERASRRVEIAQRLGSLDEEFSSINRQLRSATESETASALRQASRWVLMARREALLGERESLSAELDLVEARATLIPWQRDLAESLVGWSEDLVILLERALFERRQADATDSLEQVRAQTRLVADEVPELLKVAEQTERHAEMLWGTDGVTVESARVDAVIVETRKFITQIERISQLTRRRFEAVGHSGNINRWWPDIPDDFPRIAEARNEIARYESLIPNVQHQLIQLEQERAGYRQLEREVRQLSAERESRERAEGSTVVRDLRRTQLHMRRTQLDMLIDFYWRYSGQLVENLSLMRRFLLQAEQLASFAYERALWVRSVPGSPVPSITASLQALVWFVDAGKWVPIFTVVKQVLLEYPFRFVVVVLLIGLLIGFRRRIRERFAVLAERVTGAAGDSFWASLETLLYTILLAAPIPLAILAAGRILLRSDYTPFLSATGQALVYVACLSGLFELARQWLRPKGFAEAHLNWPRGIIRPIRQGLIWPQLLFLPLLYVSLHFGLAELALDTREELQAFNNSLGRICFIAGMSGLGLSIGEAFRPRSWKSAASRRVGFYALPFISIGFLVPALLALAGFYITGLLLAYQILWTAWLGMALMILGAISFRWLETSRRLLAYRSELRASAEKLVESSGQISLPQVYQQEEEDLKIAEERTQQLARFILILLAAVGLYLIWLEAMPMLQILKRVQIWPSITLLEGSEGSGLASTVIQTGGGVAVSSGGEAGAEEAAGVQSSTSDQPPATGESDNLPQSGATVLTLWNLLKAVLAAFITAALVKNVPGVLELALLKRTMLDSGARIALSLLLRYSIMILGAMVTFNLVGISWSKVQWLAAALTFGLGFGLQEIVANFVSGLILLVERPVRVGDAVKIGDLQGRVTRTQIRATTITLWDRSEMIVPNKEFITGKLINWTLSDSRRRIDIPLRVAYGTEVREVKRVLLEVAEQNPEVLQDPAPQALLLEFGEDALKFELRAYLDFGKGLKVRDQLLESIDQAFKDNGIEFALPQLSITLPKKSGEQQ
jgi:potassium efflux system protein